MAYRDRLTGGTNDVNPQWMSIKLVAPTTTAVAEKNAWPIPINRMISLRSAQVLEILKVELTSVFGTDADTAGAASQVVTLGSNPLHAPTGAITLAQATKPSDAGVICQFRRVTDMATYVGVREHRSPEVLDLTDGAGHGVLVGADNLYTENLQIVGATTGALYETYLRILYRFKNVSMAEYVGIVAPSR